MINISNNTFINYILLLKKESGTLNHFYKLAAYLKEH